MTESRDGMGARDPEVRAFIDQARDGGGPTSMQKARVRWGTKQKLATGAAGVVGLASWATVAKASVSIASLVIVSSAFSGGFGAFSSQQHDHRGASRAARSLQAEKAGTLIASHMVPSRLKAEYRRPQVSSTHGMRAEEPLATSLESEKRIPKTIESTVRMREGGATTNLASEVSTLAAARRALRDGDATAARRHLQKYDTTVQGGALQEERAATEVLVLCSQGKTGAAQAAVARFNQKFPRSALAPRLADSCMTQTASSP